MCRCSSWSRGCLCPSGARGSPLYIFRPQGGGWPQRQVKPQQGISIGELLSIWVVSTRKYILARKMDSDIMIVQAGLKYNLVKEHPRTGLFEIGLGRAIRCANIRTGRVGKRWSSFRPGGPIAANCRPCACGGGDAGRAQTAGRRRVTARPVVCADRSRAWKRPFDGKQTTDDHVLHPHRPHDAGGVAGAWARCGCPPLPRRPRYSACRSTWSR